MTELVSVARDSGVLQVRLNRPEKRNALTGEMYHRLIKAFVDVQEDDEIGAIVISGAGGAFTAGNDIADFLSYGESGGERPPFLFLKALARLETPLVAAVEGVAVGIGTTLLLHCDLAYAAPTARFRMPFVDLGLVPEAGSSLLLPQRVGLAKASELLLLAEAFDAAEALRLGLLNAVVPAEDLLAHATAQARKLAAKPRDAVATSRRLIRGDRSALVAAIEAESEAFGRALASPEARAAFTAFLSKPKAAAS